jgi:IPT/TIG domain/PASTA domain
MHRVRRVALSAALGLALVSAAAPDAGAAPVTVGAQLSTTFGPGDCSSAGGCTIAQFSLEGGALPASPVDGVITSWSVKGANATAGYAIRTLTRSGNSFTGVTTSAPQTPTASGAIETFPTSLPVQKGQYLGLDIPDGGTIGTAPGGRYAYLVPTLADGSTATSLELLSAVAFSAQVQPTPTITALNPTSGSLAGGTQVTITGTDFEGTTSVKFGSAAALGFAVNSETTITAFAPPAAVGGVPVSVTTNAGTATAAQAFIYSVPAPIALPAPISPSPSPSPKCTVPKLSGKTLKSAKKRIRAADCRVGKLIKKEGATAKNGEVVKQVPKPGATVPADTKVQVTLAP